MTNDQPSLLAQLPSMMPFAARLGIEFVSAAPREVRGRISWAPDLCTVAGVLHGGVLMSLADSLGATCAFLNMPPGSSTSTIESKINFFRPVTGGHVEGTARPLNAGKTVVVVQTDIRDDEGRLVAQVTQSQIVRPPA